ncbi:MAG: polyhydroxyalkanoate depolymerase [Acetobacteraceae bacterium]|nr:polyhydroxyalkanoate depolymerase [Acetobacteraceae bacterium]
MLYHHYEMQRLALTPMRMFAANALGVLEMPHNPLRHTPMGRIATAWFDSFEHSTRQFGKPRFGLTETEIEGEAVDVVEEIVHSATWVDLKRFRRDASRPDDPTLLIVAPMSGHHATLLRATVEAFLPDHDVYITDWRDAREVPVGEPDFDLDDYIAVVIDYIRLLGPQMHVVAVCQPAVPVLAAVALMEEARSPGGPRSMTLIGGPIDTREAPTKVNLFAKRHSIGWFRTHTIHHVPFGNPGFMRLVYPGFLQLAGFMAMNLDRHMQAHWQMFLHLVQGDGESLSSKRTFYEEYRSVMDLSAAFYLQTVAAVFHDHLLPRGLLTSRGRLVDPAAIERTALFTIEGERDDISGIGQTRAAHDLCRNLPVHMRAHRQQAGVGHYGLFNGRRFREEIAPAIKDFIRRHR